jgi:hypothetical protein
MSIDPVQAAIQAAIAKAAEQTNQGVATAGGGGDYVPPAEGLSVATLVAYIEVGVQQHDIPGKPSYDSNDVTLVFELNGGKNKAEEVDGKKIAKRISITEKLSSNEKANYFKIFNQLNTDGTATHGAQLLGRHYLVNVVHEKSKAGKVFATLKGKVGYNFMPPVVVKGDPLDPENQTSVPVPKPEQISPNKCFLWDYASKEMWDSIFIDGEYPARKDEKTGVEYPAKSKNQFQNLIRGAKNFKGSPIEAIVGNVALDLAESPIAGEAEAGAVNDLVADAQSEASAAASADPLDGLL